MCCDWAPAFAIKGDCVSAGWGGSCSTISSTVMAVIEPNRRVKRVKRQGASHVWRVEHQHGVHNLRRVLLRIVNISPGSFFCVQQPPKGCRAHQKAVAVLSAQLASSSHTEKLLFLVPAAFFTSIVHNPRAHLTCLWCVSVQVSGHCRCAPVRRRARAEPRLSRLSFRLHYSAGASLEVQPNS